jgi:hypothetical protein
MWLGPGKDHDFGQNVIPQIMVTAKSGDSAANCWPPIVSTVGKKFSIPEGGDGNWAG